MPKKITTRSVALILLRSSAWPTRPPEAPTTTRRRPRRRATSSRPWVRRTPRRRCAPHGATPSAAFDFYAPENQNGGGPRKVQSVTAGEWGSLTANSTVHDVDAPAAGDDPANRREWQSDESWRCPVAGPLFVFGQCGGGGTQVEQQDTKVSGKTGVGCKWAPAQDAEFVVSSGPSVTYTDPLRLDRVQEHSEWLLEVQGRWPLLGKIGLEYQATAAPALTPLDHDWMNQDVGLAMPVCTGGKFRVGARHKWENVPDPKATPDSTQLYFGLELSR